MAASIHIGTSGWHYKHWKGTFYPEGTKDADQLKQYIKTFRTVELNNSFYRLPEAATFTAWKEAVPDGFVFSVKASRYITHVKKLHDTAEAAQTFLERAAHLGNKLGPVLFQLPPGWSVNIGRLEEFLNDLPAKYRYTFEFRNRSWYDQEVYALLRKHRCAFCIYELDGHLSPTEVTAGFVYVRLHGPGRKYQGSYTETVLKGWMDQCREWQHEGRDVYMYFDNDQAGYAAFNARRLLELLK